MDEEVVGLDLAVRPRLTVARERAVDEPRVGLAEVVGPDTEPGGGSRREVLAEDVGGPSEPAQHLLALRQLRVHRHVPLAGVEGDETGGEAPHGTVPTANDVAAPRLLDLDDVGAEGRQDERAERQRDGLLQRDDADAGKGVAHQAFGVGKMSRLGACSRFQTITERRYLITRSPFCV